MRNRKIKKQEIPEGESKEEKEIIISNKYLKVMLVDKV